MLLQLQVAVIEDRAMTEEAKARVCELIAASDKSLVDGADEYLQLLNVATQMQVQLCRPASAAAMA